MDLLTSKIKPMYFKYLTAALGSALISSIYGVVDMAMVGQYQGPEGTAALAVVSPVWNIIYSLGLLMGIGGSVLFSTLRGESAQNQKKSNEYFTAAVIGVVAAFLRNDGNPGLATKAVLFGGIFNVFGDYFFVFVLQMGIMGAGLATAMGILTMLFNRQILKYAVGTAAVFGMIRTALAVFVPNLFVRIFMTPTEEILSIAPNIIRSYGISFLLLPFNIFSTYYFQALMRPKTSFAVSVSRGAVISGILILILPVAMGANAIWFAMPITELLVAIYVAMRMIRYTKAINEKERQVE